MLTPKSAQKYDFLIFLKFTSKAIACQILGMINMTKFLKPFRFWILNFFLSKNVASNPTKTIKWSFSHLGVISSIGCKINGAHLKFEIKDETSYF